MGISSFVPKRTGREAVRSPKPARILRLGKKAKPYRKRMNVISGLLPTRTGGPHVPVPADV